MEVPDPVMLVVDRRAVSPEDADVVRVTEPEKLPIAEMVTVTLLSEAPASSGPIAVALVEMLKSGVSDMWHVMVAVVCESVPLVPVTVTA